MKTRFWFPCFISYPYSAIFGLFHEKQRETDLGIEGPELDSKLFVFLPIVFIPTLIDFVVKPNSYLQSRTYLLSEQVKEWWDGMKCETIYHATKKSRSSLKAFRQLLWAGVLNLIWSASRKSKRFEFEIWRECSIFLLLAISSLLIKDLPVLRPFTLSPNLNSKKYKIKQIPKRDILCFCASCDLYQSNLHTEWRWLAKKVPAFVV